MDAEVFRLKEKNELIDGKPQYMDLETRKELVYGLSSRFGNIFNEMSKGSVNKNNVIKCVAESIVDLLETFSYINVYPDYFWRVIMQMNVVLKKITDGKSKNDLTEREKDIVEAHEKYLLDEIRSGIYLDRDVNSINVNDNYTELVSFYSVFGLRHNNIELLDSKKFLDKFVTKCLNHNVHLLNTDDVIDDVMCLMKMLFEYMCFFAEIGINPKEYVDTIMNEREIKQNGQK